MQLRKDILLFYLLILVSAGVIVAADKPGTAPAIHLNGVKCCNLPCPVKPSIRLNTFAEGILRFKA